MLYRGYSTVEFSLRRAKWNARTSRKFIAADTRIAPSSRPLVSSPFFTVRLSYPLVLARALKDTESTLRRFMDALSERIDRIGLYGPVQENIHPHVVAIRHARRHGTARMIWRSYIKICGWLPVPLPPAKWLIMFRWRRDKNKRSHVISLWGKYCPGIFARAITARIAPNSGRKPVGVIVGKCCVCHYQACHSVPWSKFSENRALKIYTKGIFTRK